MTVEQLLAGLANLLPAVGLYVAVRVDLASMRVRLDHLERDVYPSIKPPRSSNHG